MSKIYVGKYKNEKSNMITTKNWMGNYPSLPNKWADIVDIFIICNMENWKYGGKTFQKATLACLFIREFRVLQITEANPKLIGHMILK